MNLNSNPYFSKNIPDIEMDPQDIKRELIIETALQRFAHFGLNKTTMNEIAKDLKFSKALLYYYFPDKINLYAAVMQKIFSDMSHILEIELSKAKTPEIAIDKFIENKQSFLERYYPILDFSKLSNIEKYSDLKVTLEQANKAEVGQLKQIIEIGLKTNVYEVEDVDYTSKLLFDILRGVRMLYFSSVQIQFGIDKEFLNNVSKKNKEIICIFLKGLRK